MKIYTLLASAGLWFIGMQPVLKNDCSIIYIIIKKFPKKVLSWLCIFLQASPMNDEKVFLIQKILVHKS